MQILNLDNAKKLASKISKTLDHPIIPMTLHQFPSGEYICKLTHALMSKVSIIGSIKNNDDLMAILSIIDAAKRAGASEICLVAPYIAYGRQDVMQAPFSSVGIEIIATILNASGITHLITADIHSISSLQSFHLKVTHITSHDIITYHKEKILHDIDIIVAPDAGAKERLGSLGLKTICLTKTRTNTGIKMCLKPEDTVENKKCLIIDDIYDSGATMMSAQDLLLAAGASNIKGYVTHFLSNKPYPLYITDSITPTEESGLLKVVSLDEVVCKAINAPTQKMQPLDSSHKMQDQHR